MTPAMRLWAQDKLRSLFVQLVRSPLRYPTLLNFLDEDDGPRLGNLGGRSVWRPTLQRRRRAQIHDAL